MDAKPAKRKDARLRPPQPPEHRIDGELSNEDLVTANEEIVSMNEELQSANEELQTSTEELQ